MSTEIPKASEAGRTFPFLKTSRLDLPGWKVALYSLAIVAMPIVGELLGEAFAVISVLEILETVPTLLCLIFVMRLPGPPALPVPCGLRIALIALASVLIMLSLGDQQSGGLGAWAFSLAVANALAISVTEEVTFRWSLHRLWGALRRNLLCCGKLFGVRLDALSAWPASRGCHCNHRHRVRPCQNSGHADTAAGCHTCADGPSADGVQIF